MWATWHRIGCVVSRNGRKSRCVVPLRRNPTKSLDASGGGALLNLRGAAKGVLTRAAASTQPLGCYFNHEVPTCTNVFVAARRRVISGECDEPRRVTESPSRNFWPNY